MKTILICFIALLSFPLHAQRDITPGVGFEDLPLGMSIKKKQIKKMLGYITNEYSKKELQKMFSKMDSSFLSHVDFDYMYEFEEGNKYGIYELYLKEGKIVYYEVSTSFLTSSSPANMTLLKNIKFEDDRSDILKILGDDYYLKKTEYSTTIYYLKKGVYLIFDEKDKLQRIDIFKPFEPNEAFIGRLQLTQP